MSNGSNVLVVDDDPNIRSAFEDLLKKEHCNMIPASSAEEALQQLAEHRVDLVITDVRLKYQSGVTLFIRVRQMRSSLPIIVITGHPNLITEKDIKLYGAEYYFLKPLELDPLREAIRSCLHRSSALSWKRNESPSLTHFHHH